MKRLLLPLLLLSSTAFAVEPLTSSEKKEVESLLAEAASKMIYLSRDCHKEIDPDKFKELAKLKAFAEGYMTIDGISWEHVKRKAHQEYGMLKIDAPLGELCDQYEASIKDSYKFLK